MSVVLCLSFVICYYCCSAVDPVMSNVTCWYWRSKVARWLLLEFQLNPPCVSTDLHTQDLCYFLCDPYISCFFFLCQSRNWHDSNQLFMIGRYGYCCFVFTLFLFCSCFVCQESKINTCFWSVYSDISNLLDWGLVIRLPPGFSIWKVDSATYCKYPAKMCNRNKMYRRDVELESGILCDFKFDWLTRRSSL